MRTYLQHCDVESLVLIRSDRDRAALTSKHILDPHSMTVANGGADMDSLAATPGLLYEAGSHDPLAFVGEEENRHSALDIATVSSVSDGVVSKLRPVSAAAEEPQMRPYGL